MTFNAGSFGSITFIVPEVRKIRIKEPSGYIEIPIINGYSRLHTMGDPLNEVTVDFRFSSMPGVGYNVSAWDKLTLLRNQRGSTTSQVLTLCGTNLGSRVVKEITWEALSQAGNMRPIVIDCQVVFLDNPV